MRILASTTPNLLSRRLLVTGGIAAAITLPDIHRALAQSTARTPGATPEATPPANETPASVTFGWLLDVLNDGLTDGDIADRFTGSFLSNVAPADIIALMTEIGQGAPYEVETYVDTDDGLEASAVIAGVSGERIAVSLTVTDDTPPLISGLWFRPAPPALSTWDEFDQALAALPGVTSFLAAEVVDGACVPIHTVNPAERLAIGSVFKLYILGTLADQVRAGNLSWDDPLAIRDEWKASFSAPMSGIPVGEERTLREFASEMISVSDNTATDHLLFHLGRENVEAMQARMGHLAPEVNTPMLSAQELFQLKLGASPELVAAYLAAPVEERRDLLANDVARIELGPLAASWWQEPIMIDQLEWFASVEEICHALATLSAWSLEPGLEPITGILAIDPGLELDPTVWPYAGYKGGSEIGVLSMSWLLGHASGRRFILAATFNNPEPASDILPEAGPLLDSAVQLLTSSVG